MWELGPKNHCKKEYVINKRKQGNYPIFDSFSDDTGAEDNNEGSDGSNRENSGDFIDITQHSDDEKINIGDSEELKIERFWNEG